MSACFSAEDLPASVALAEPVVGMALYWTASVAAIFQVKLLKELNYVCCNDLQNKKTILLKI